MHLRFLSSFKHKVDLKSSHTSSAGGAERGKQRVLRWGGVASTSILISLSAIRGLTENIPDDLFKTLKFPFPSLIFQLYAPTEITQDVLSQSQRLPYRPSCACATRRQEMATVLIKTQVKQEHLFWSGLWCNAMKWNQRRWLLCELCYYYQHLCHLAPGGIC